MVFNPVIGAGHQQRLQGRATCRAVLSGCGAGFSKAAKHLEALAVAGDAQASPIAWLALRARLLNDALARPVAQGEKSSLPVALLFAPRYKGAVFQATALTSTTMSGYGSPRTMTVVRAGPLLSKYSP